MIVLRYLVINLSYVFCLYIATSKYNMNGIMKVVLFVVSMLDALVSPAAQAFEHAILAIAVILISPVELQFIFTTYTYMMYFEVEQDSHSTSLFMLLMVLGYNLLIHSYINIGQDINSSQFALKQTPMAVIEGNQLDNLIVSLGEKMKAFRSKALLYLLCLAHFLATCLQLLFGSSSLAAIRKGIRQVYVVVCLLIAVGLLFERYHLNMRVKIKSL